MKKRYLIMILFLTFFSINEPNAEEIYEFDREVYSADEFAEIFEVGCNGTSGTLCSGTCSDGTESDKIRYYHNPCGDVDSVTKFKIGDGSKLVTKRELGDEIFNKYFKEEIIHYFEQNHFETIDEFGDFATQVCRAENAPTTCMALCINPKDDDPSTFSSSNPYPCGDGYENMEKFRIGDGSMEQTFEALQSAKCRSDKSCWEYLFNDYSYCKEYTKLNKNDPRYIFCNKMNDQEEVTGKCAYVFKFDDRSIQFFGALTTDKKDLEFVINDNDFYAPEPGTFNDGILSKSGTTLYFYPKNEDFNSFKTEYIKRYTADEKCPTLCFGYDVSYTWYTALDATEFEDKKYRLGNIQCSSSGKTTLNKDRDNKYITSNIITFENCEKLFEESPELLNMIKFILNIVKIGIPILLIGLGVIDFSKAIFVDKEDEMKKAQEKFIKRIIIGVCIFLVPTVLKLILTIGNSVWGNVISADFCGILE